MIDFYYIIAQKPFYKSQPDSFIERKRCFYFCSRDPSLKITELSQFNSGPVAMGRHFSKRNLSSFPTPQVEVLGWDINCSAVTMIDATQVCIWGGGRKATRCMSTKESTGPFIPVVGHPDEKGQREAETPHFSDGLQGFRGKWAVWSPAALLSRYMLYDPGCPFHTLLLEVFGTPEATDLSDKLIFKMSRFSKLLSLRSGCAFEYFIWIWSYLTLMFPCEIHHDFWTSNVAGTLRRRMVGDRKAQAS